MEVFADFCDEMQERICKAAEELDGDTTATFCKDEFTRPGGRGCTRVLQGGRLLEKAAVNVSVLSGTLTPERAQAMRQRGRDGVDATGGQPYAAAALSLVFHPRSPHVPTLRADVRLFAIDGGDGGGWYGGGCDLTPNYLEEQDIVGFHSHWRDVCAKHDAKGSDGIYRHCKAHCDEYFYIPARGEHRGTGGIFFDDAHTPEAIGGPSSGADDMQAVDAFTRDVAENLLPSWEPIVARRRGTPVTDAEREWQCRRRGRYIEFNLLNDRGVRFGLVNAPPPGQKDVPLPRMESIMVSAPPEVRWTYVGDADNRRPEGDREEQMLEVLRNPRDWIPN